MSHAIRSKTINVDDEFIVQEPLLHDAEIVSLVNERDKAGNKNLVVHLISESGVPLQIKMHGVQSLRCDSFMPQNIVLHLLVKKSVDVTSDLRENAKSFYLDANKVSQISAEIQKGNLVFIHVLPSLGCKIVAVCKSVEFYEGR